MSGTDGVRLVTSVAIGVVGFMLPLLAGGPGWAGAAVGFLAFLIAYMSGRWPT